MVLEISPADADHSITGSIDDAWQVALEDVGPAGTDKGKGGKYIILPPGYKEKAPEGYIALPSNTYTGFVILRSNVKSTSDADIASAVAYGKRIKFYPLSQTANRPETTFVDAFDQLFDSTIPYDLRFVQREPWLERDKAMIDSLKTIGIEKGKPFNPDAKTRTILNNAALEAHAWIDIQYQGIFSPPFNEDCHWALPGTPAVVEGMTTNFTNPDAYAVDGRAVTYSMGYFSAKHLGEGQFYLMAIVDKDGKPLDGGSAYRLTVPANAPVRLYWSATAYDRATHALIRESKWSSRASNTPGLVKNADGSVDIWFAPAAPGARGRTGCRRRPAGDSKSCSASTVPRSRCSRRPGCCRISRKSTERRTCEAHCRSDIGIADRRRRFGARADPGRHARSGHRGRLCPGGVGPLLRQRRGEGGRPGQVPPPP
jgi:hypothetical protein